MDIVVLILASATITALLCWLYWRWTNRRTLELAALVPGPPTWPVLGNAWVFMSRPEDILNIIGGFVSTYGEYTKFWIGPQLSVCVTNPTDIKYLLTSNKINQKGPLYNFFGEIIGPGILTGGSPWRNYRKIATPSYNKKSVRHYSAIFNKEAQELARVLSCKDPGTTFDVYFDVVHFTTQCVCQTLMGLSKEDSKNVKRMDELVAKTQGLYNFFFEKMTKWWLQIPLVYYLTGRSKMQSEYVKLVEDMASDIVKKRKKALESSNKTDEDNIGIVDRYIFSGELSEGEIVKQTFALFTTSQEASAKIASAVLKILAHLPDWQDKVYTEITEVIGPDEKFVTEEQIKKLQYLDMVYKEALRYLSIAAFIQRTVEEEIAIDNGRLILPANTAIIFPIHMLHRDIRYWDDPYQVKPDRFLPENVKKRDPNAFVPFSLGAMDCLGRVYATNLIKTIVVHVLRRVQLEADGRLEDLELQVAISVKFAKGYNLRAKPRRRQSLRIG